MKNIVLVSLTTRVKIEETYGLRKLMEYVYDKDPSVRNHIQIQLVQLGVYDDKLDNINKILEKKPHVIGFSTMITNIQYILWMCESIKKKEPDIKIMLGGPQVSDLHWTPYEYSTYIDAVIRGEGEATFKDVVDNYLVTGKLGSKDIKGISYLEDNGEVVHNEERPFIPDLDELPYIYPNVKGTSDMAYSIETTRGCYYRCGYCQMPYIKFRRHSLDYALNEIDNMAKAGIKIVVILDSSFTFNLERATAIATRLKKYGMKYTFTAKPEELNPEFIDLFIETGAFEINLGLQTINFETLKLLNRPLIKDKFEKNLRNLMDRVKDHDIKVTIDVMCGLPGDNLKSFCNTLNFAYHLKPARLGLYPFMLLPNTRLFREAGKYGIKSLPPIQETIRVIGRYNCHYYGLVTENYTFSSEELDTGRKMCLYLTVIFDLDLTQLIDKILEIKKMQVSEWLLGYLPYISGRFYALLETLTFNSMFKRKFIVSQLLEDFQEYVEQTKQPEVAGLIYDWISSSDKIHKEEKHKLMMKRGKTIVDGQG